MDESLFSFEPYANKLHSPAPLLGEMSRRDRGVYPTMTSGYINNLLFLVYNIGHKDET